MAINILRLSTDLQTKLIAKLTNSSDLADLLDMIVASAMDVLKADACSIYMENRPAAKKKSRRSATMVAARGYQSYAVNTAECSILPATDVPPSPRPDEKLGLTGWVISTGRAFLAKSPEDLFQHPHWSGKYDNRQAPAHQKLKLAAFLAVPLRNLYGQIIGVFKAERLESASNTPFSVEDQIVLEALGRVTSRCIAYAEEARRERLSAAITAWTLNVIEEAVATEGELDAFLDIAVRVVASSTQADSCAVFLIDESKKTLTQRAGWGSQVLRTLIRSYKLGTSAQVAGCINESLCNPPHCRIQNGISRNQRVGLTAWVAATGRSFHARNYDELTEHCHHLGRFDKPNFEEDQQCGAWLGVPLRVGGVITGVLKIENISRKGINDTRDFTPDIQQRLDVLANSIALAIERLQNQSPARYEVIQKAMPTLLEILQGGVDVPILVEKVVTKTAMLFNARACALFLKEGNKLIQPPWAAVGWAGKGPEVRSYDLVPRQQIVEMPDPGAKKGLTVWIAVTKQKFIAKSNLELVLHPHHLGNYDPQNFQEGEKCETFMGIPLLVGAQKELIGVLKVETKMRDTPLGKEFAYFNEQDELVFDLIGNSAAIAIQNARMLEARRLAHSIITQPIGEALVELYRFTKTRMEVASSTLDSTAQEVKQRDPDKARIIHNFASVLLPKFNVVVLEQLATDQQHEDIRHLLRYFANGIKAQSCTEIINLRGKPLSKLSVGQILKSDFFLSDSMHLLLGTLDRLDALWDRYARDCSNKSALLNCLELLREDQERFRKLNLFDRSILGRMFGCWRTLIEAEFQKWLPIPNPYVAGKPLAPDSPVFVGREDIFRWIRENLKSQHQNNVIVLHGGWHTGKTSILKQLYAGPLGKSLREQHPHPVLPVFIDLQNLADPDMEMFLFRMAEFIQGALKDRSVKCLTPDARDFRRSPYRAFDRFLNRVSRVFAEKDNAVLLIMLDEFERLDDRVVAKKMDSEIFAYLRSVMQHQSYVTFILAGRHRLDEMTPEYKNIVFNVALHKEVSFLRDDEAIDLILEPIKTSAVTYEPAVVGRILELSGRHPYLIQQLCQACVALLNQEHKGRNVSLRHLDQAIGNCLAHNAVLEDLWKKQIQENDRKLLEALAKLAADKCARDLQGAEYFISERELASEARLPGRTTRESVERLLAQKIIEARPDAHKRNVLSAEYRYGMDILRCWVTRTSRLPK